MKCFPLWFAFLFTVLPSALAWNDHSCAADDLKHRISLQNKLAGVCLEMSKEMKAYPHCAQCPESARTGSSGVMTWDALLTHMDSVSAWGNDKLDAWKKPTHPAAMQTAVKKSFLAPSLEQVKDQKTCLTVDAQIRSQVKALLGSSHARDQSWEELLTHVDQLLHRTATKKMSALVAKSHSVIRNAVGATKSSFEARVRNLKASNPLFSEAACMDMHASKVKTGGSVAPTDFVVGCGQVCDMVRKMKKFWGSGEMAEYACGKGALYGCVYDGTPPVTLSGIGC